MDDASVVVDDRAHDGPPWGIALLAAVGAIIGGGVLLAWPAPTVLVFSQVAGWTMGVVGLLGAVEEGSQNRFKTRAFAKGLLVGGVGIALIIWPGRTILVATVLAGGWLIADGGARVLDTMWEESPGAEIVGNLIGLVEMAFGVLVMARPISGARAAAAFAGLGLIVHGLGRIWDLLRRNRSSAPA